MDSPKEINPLMKTVLELGPVLAFFAAYMMLKDEVFTIGGTEYSGFIVVTAGFVPLILLSNAIMWKLTGQLSRMQVMTLVLVVVFGGLTIWLNDERFLKIKPTIFFGTMGALLGIGLMRGQSYLRYVMEGLMPLKDEGWMILTRRFMLFLFSMAAINEVIWRFFSETTWVYFTTFGDVAAMFAFFMAQARLFSDYALGEGESET